MTNDALFGTARDYDCGYRAGHAAAQAALAAEKARADKAEALLREIVPPKVREKVMSKSAIPHHIRLATAQAIFDAIRAALEKRDAD